MGKYRLIGKIIYPGMQYSKYLISNGSDIRLIYEDKLHKMCKADMIVNCESSTKHVDGVDTAQELSTNTSNLLDIYSVKIDMRDWICDKDKAIESAKTKLLRKARVS